jgi:hypothetical protein
MTTITLDDALISEVIAISHQQNPQEAVAKILVDYLQQHKNKPSLFNQLRLVGDSAGDDLEILFQRDQDTGRSLEL